MKQASTDILDHLLHLFGFTRDIQLATKLGVSPQAISQARRKNKIPESWLLRIARTDNISLDALLASTPQHSLNESLLTPVPQSTQAQPHTPLLSSPPVQAQLMRPQSSQSDIDFLLVPLVAARLSAGAGSLESESEILDHFAFQRDWLARKGNPDQMVLMRVYGDSMEPTIRHNDMVLVDQGKTHIVPHTIYAVGFNEEIYIKQLETLPGHRMILRSHNERYDPIEVNLRNAEADNAVRIIGKIIWWCREA